MQTGTKIVIGVVITILLIFGLIVGGLAGLIFYVDYTTKQAEIDGREFGKTTDQNGCLEKGFSFEPPKNYFANMKITKFVSECLKFSRPVPNFCNGVPTEAEKAKCPQYPNEEPCFQTIRSKQSYCS